MELELIFAVTMFLTTIACLLAGYSVALTLGGVSLIFGLIGIMIEKKDGRQDELKRE